MDVSDENGGDSAFSLKPSKEVVCFFPIIFLFIFNIDVIISTYRVWVVGGVPCSRWSR